jgi:tRNA-specific 2-thiouridylase
LRNNKDQAYCIAAQVDIIVISIIIIMIKLNNIPLGSRIVVAMSGGVDSSTVAALLHEAGYEVIGVTLQLYDQGAVLAKKGACCAGQDIYDAKMVADRLNIPHYVLDYESKFKEAVIEDFVETYLQGETPLPCVRCNQSVKFKDLLKVAKDLNAVGLATGHYVQRVDAENGPELHKGMDITKDQGYFLFATTKEQLNFLHFPIGSLTKEETREHAARFGLEVADKPDSQDICFVAGGSYADFITKIRPNAAVEGKIMHVDGYEIGTHNGIINYTIGQRKGLGIAFFEPLYVTKIDPEQNIVYVGSKTALICVEFIIKEVNWLGENDPETYEDLRVRIRSAAQEVPAKLKKLDDDRMKVTLLVNASGVAPGQACVIYNGSRVLGGGWIVK